MCIDKQRTLPKLEKSICLTGFMGSGKSSVGKILACLLKVDFFDSDELIAEKLGMTIGHIFKCYGETYFRSREAEVLEILGQKPPGSCVIATGGGAVLQPGSIAALRKNGLIVYLDLSAAEAYDRIKEMDDRPLLQVEQPLEKMEELFVMRKPYYLQADICVCSAGRTLQQVAATIIHEVYKEGV